MNIAQLMTLLAFVASIGASMAFFSRGRNIPPPADHEIPPRPSLGARLFSAVAVLGLLGSLTLIYFLITHQFQYAYVAKYSSLSQPLIYRISAFWAGQEGTFLLWAMLTSVMGVVFIRKWRQEDGLAMGIVSVFIAFLYLLMLVKSPFETTSTVPADGSGMNPLLQDPWMAVHPPLLFVGYAATIFPFALVVSALFRREYGHWIASGFSWTLFAAVSLGAGIIIGGFWAYEVLGWGGYWGWDPVENSSLVPWLVLLALIHGLLIQNSRGALLRTNMFLGIISFLLVLYATFLTRSGVLADFSVHSFVDLGINNYLIAVMVVGTVIGGGIFFVRFRELGGPKIEVNRFNREVALLLSLYVLLASAVFTFVGMSSPILTGLVGKASQVDTSFYNRVNLPIGIGIAFLLGVTPFLGWGEDNRPGLLKRLTMPLALTMLSLLIAVVAGVRTPTLLIFVGMSAFALISNVIVAFRQYRSGWLGLGGPIAHIGVALLLIGIIGSGNYDEARQMVLTVDEPKSSYGYDFTFRGIDYSRGIKPIVVIEVSDGKSPFLATPKLYYSEYTRSIMREPDITIFPLNDLYISPLEIKTDEHEDGHHTMHELAKGETKVVEGYEMTFERFDLGAHGEPGAMTVGAVLRITTHGQQHEIVPRLVIDERGERQSIPADLPILQTGTNGQGKPHITLNAISVEEKKILLELHGVGEDAHTHSPMQLIVEVSTKPLMMVVWTGVVLILGGTGIAFGRRALA